MFRSEIFSSFKEYLVLSLNLLKISSRFLCKLTPFHASIFLCLYSDFLIHLPVSGCRYHVYEMVFVFDSSRGQGLVTGVRLEAASCSVAGKGVVDHLDGPKM